MTKLTSKLLALICGVLTATASAQNTAPKSTIPDDRNFKAHLNFQTQWEDYLATKKGKPVEIIFIGDSITEQWRWGAGKPVWEKNFADRALDFGEGSDLTQHTLWRLENLDVKGFQPKVAVILIGTNNINDTPEDIAAGVKVVVEKSRQTFSGVKVILVSILPNARATEKTAAANELIQTFADDQSVFYLDLASKMPPQGDNWKGLSRDKLHLTTEGYALWAAELQPLIAKLLPAADAAKK